MIVNKYTYMYDYLLLFMITNDYIYMTIHDYIDYVYIYIYL